MTTNFTASNGIQIFGGTGYIKWSSLTNFNQSLEFAPTSVADEAFAEWYQHRRDQELGRWRDPEAPDKVVYHLPSAKREATGRTVRVLDERLGATVICNEHLERSSDPTNAEPSAARYFAAHPEPKPWHDAEAGTFWRVHPKYTGATGRLAIAHGDDTFTDECGIGWTTKEITDATRLHPAESRDE